ncbi:MAG: TonB-dependent receptor, partial [Alphaproteobacteria bacterium]|nr:TonB-dependent receptor [Alphaproteobacteria bacterium]
MFKRFMSGAAISALSLAVSAPIVQAQQTTSAIRGELVSTGGGAIANAQVEITHVPTGAVTKATSNAAGIFDARGLIVGGPYNVKVQAKGYEGQAYENVYLGLGDALRLDAALEPAVNDIVVTAKRVARPTDVGSRTTLGKESIGSVVTPRRDIRDIARRDPLVTIDNVTRGTGPTGGIYIAGSTPRLNRITIDGVRSADDFGLNTGGLSTTRGPVSISAIEQLAVQAVPFDVEDGDFTGGAVNIVLRSGSNDFRGSIFANPEALSNFQGAVNSLLETSRPSKTHLIYCDAAVQGASEPYDLIILDLGLPGRPG